MISAERQTAAIAVLKDLMDKHPDQARLAFDTLNELDQSAHTDQADEVNDAVFAFVRVLATAFQDSPGDEA